MKRNIFIAFLLLFVSISVFAQSFLCTYKGGYFIKNGSTWHEYRPQQKDGVWNSFTEYSYDNQYYYLDNGKCKLSIPKTKNNSIWIKIGNADWKKKYTTINVYKYCPVFSKNIFAYQNGFFVKDGNNWQEYDPTQNMKGPLDSFTQYKEDDGFYYIKNARITLAIPRKINKNFCFVRNGSWVSLYVPSALYDANSPDAQSGNTPAANNSNNQKASNSTSSNSSVLYLDVLRENSQYDKIKEDFGTIIRSTKEEYESQTVYRYFYDSGWEKILSVKKQSCIMCHGDGKLHNWYANFPPPSNVCGHCEGTGKELPTVIARNTNSAYMYLSDGEKMFRNSGGYGSNDSQSSQSNGTSRTNSSSSYSRCRYCGGGGGCNSCNGTGHKFNGYSGHEDSCPSCRGTGRCQICRGTGRL